jgi:hypothetical protein
VIDKKREFCERQAEFKFTPQFSEVKPGPDFNCDPGRRSPRAARESARRIPSLAGLDRLVLYKQLDDFRSGTRLSGPMSAIAQSLKPQQYAVQKFEPVK